MLDELKKQHLTYALCLSFGIQVKQTEENVFIFHVLQQNVYDTNALKLINTS